MAETFNLPECWIRVQELDIHYKCIGEGKPVLLLHGSGSDWQEWRKNIDSLSAHFKLYIPDLPGFGLSQMPEEPVSPQSAAVFLRDLVQALDIESPHIVAHSLGGLVAMTFALEYPRMVDKLIIIDSAGIGKLSLGGSIRLAFFKVLGRLMGAKPQPKYKQGVPDEWFLGYRLADITAKTMILWGERDPYLPVALARAARHMIPGSELHIFPRCGHAPQREHWQQCNQIIHRFLAG